MKNDRLAILVLACAAATAASASAFAQSALPQCETANYDGARGLFTVINPAPDTVHQQCLLTIHPAQASASGVQSPAPFLVEGYYNVVMSGGGGGGGAGNSSGGGGGGAGATPFKTIKLLSPGIYKLTIGAGGEGGMPGRPTPYGGSTRLTNADTGEHIAGYERADSEGERYQAPGNGRGGVAAWGGSTGGDGEKVKPTVVAEAQSGSPLQVSDYSGTPGQAGTRIDRSVRMAQPGGTLQIAGYTGAPGPSGGESGSSARTDDDRQAFAGGGGGAGFGNGGAGEPADGSMAAGVGDLGGGGGGGRGGKNIADPGGRGGHGFIQLSLFELVPQAAAAEPEVVAPPSPAITAPEPAAPKVTPAPAASRPARRDRN